MKGLATSWIDCMWRRKSRGSRNSAEHKLHTKESAECFRMCRVSSPGRLYLNPQTWQEYTMLFVSVSCSSRCLFKESTLSNSRPHFSQARLGFRTSGFERLGSRFLKGLGHVDPRSGCAMAGWIHGHVRELLWRFHLDVRLLSICQLR